MITDIPVLPDGPGARRLLEDELAKPEYQLSTVWQRFLRWLGGLSEAAGTGGSGAWIAVLLVVVIVAGAFLIFGIPRLQQRRAATDTLFAVDDTRDLATLRAAARTAFAAADYSLAAVEWFRAIVRQLADRGLIDVHPGTTARTAANAATAAVPARAEDFAWAAQSFEDVRYREHPVTRAEAERMAAFDEALERIEVPEPVGAP